MYSYANELLSSVLAFVDGKKSAGVSDVLVLPWFSTTHISSHYPDIFQERNTGIFEHVNKNPIALYKTHPQYNKKNAPVP